ncbi:hypothetical protein I8748_16030 [Nostoc sp. CENA67]|uniref:Uncharacterized protein n=1 Tax=Amazonocrinis nigriterrae CENA67 TaxID=2794033 RepID=A0A8J7HPT1_9NOST|nr:hypothetical protein [Amazonocrinis nigriterrae CENA67]
MFVQLLTKASIKSAIASFFTFAFIDFPYLCDGWVCISYISIKLDI